jgi:hypothetical protein
LTTHAIKAVALKKIARYSKEVKDYKNCKTKQKLYGSRIANLAG